ncbi:MAG TPA: hypothetical protein VF590_01475 [Isosphaeraceae bacterium]|jgi:hypothetical protein
MLDLSALVIGYGLAALLMRALWPSGAVPTVPVAVVLGLEYLWLGLAMSGPIVLMLDQRVVRPWGDAGSGRATGAEMAWLLIGIYWIVLALLVVPSRLSIRPWFGLLPIVAAWGLWLFGPRLPRSPATAVAWTHHAAVALLVTWPLAWVALILLSKTMF